MSGARAIRTELTPQRVTRGFEQRVKSSADERSRATATQAAIPRENEVRCEEALLLRDRRRIIDDEANFASSPAGWTRSCVCLSDGGWKLWTSTIADE